MSSLLAIIMPVRNGAAHLQDALDSIAIQDTSHTELIAIDDGSTDNTLSILKHFRAQSVLPVKIISTNQIGPAAARNIALAHTFSQFITFLDHDDTWPKERITSHLTALNKQTNADILIGLTHIIPITKAREKDVRLKGNKLYNVNLGAATFRRRVFDAIGNFDESLNFSEDHDLLFRARERELKIAYLNQTALHYRLHDTNMTKDKTAEELALPKVLLASIRRRDKKQLSPFGQTY